MDFIYHFMPTMWKNKMIEQWLNQADSTVKEMTDFLVTRLENKESNKHEKRSFMSSKKKKNQRKGNKMTLTKVL